jgi:hypothetical protein
VPFFGGLELHSRFYQKTRSAFVGLQQSGSNSVALPPGSAVGDMALFYGCENTSSTASGVQGIAAGPAGWTVMSGAGVAQISTTPTFTTRGLWWKKLVQADITAGVVSFTIGSLGITAACGVLVFRGGSTFSLVSSGGISGTQVNTSTPAKPANAILMIYLLTLRADLNEVITPDTGHNWTNLYPGAMFAGAFFFRDPATWVAAEAGHWSWTTTSGGFQHNIAIL